jgi:hypothetical protein
MGAPSIDPYRKDDFIGAYAQPGHHISLREESLESSSISAAPALQKGTSFDPHRETTFNYNRWPANRSIKSLAIDHGFT